MQAASIGWGSWSPSPASGLPSTRATYGRNSWITTAALTPGGHRPERVTRVGGEMPGGRSRHSRRAIPRLDPPDHPTTRPPRGVPPTQALDRRITAPESRGPIGCLRPGQSHAVLTGGATCPRTRGNFTGQHGNLASPGATAVETWGAVLRARAPWGSRKPLPRGNFRPTTPRSLSVLISSEAAPVSRLGFAAPRQHRLLAPPAHRCQLNVKLGRHVGSSAARRKPLTGPATQHMKIARRKDPGPPFWPAVHPRRARPTIAQARSHFTPRAWSTGGCCSPAARQTCGRPGGASWRQDHAGQPQRSIGRPPTRRSPARSSRLRTHHPPPRPPRPPKLFHPPELLDGNSPARLPHPALPRPTGTPA